MTNKTFTFSKRQRRQHALGALIAGLFLSSAALAADSSEANKPAGIPVGPLTVYPTIDVTVKHDDNIAQSNTGRISSNVTIIAPAVTLEGKSGANFFGLKYRLEDGNYSRSGNDDYTDQFAGAYASFALGVRGDLKLNADYTEQHDARGTIAGQNASYPEEYRTSGVRGAFSWGAEGAPGKIELEAGYLDKEYTTNFSGIQQYSDRENKDAGATFYWKVMPKTQLLFQAKQTEIDYKHVLLTNQDSTETRYYVGATWEATALTSGTVKLGTLKKDFEAHPSYSTGSWDVGVTWSPLTYSHFNLNTNRQTNEVDSSVGDAVRSSNYALAWKHDWNSFLASNVRMGKLEEDYVLNGSVAGQRADSSKTFGLGFDYQARRWLKLGADYSHTDRSSNLGANDFKRNVLMFTAGASL